MTKQQLALKITNVKKNIEEGYNSYDRLLSAGDEEKANKVADYIDEREKTLEKLEAEYKENFK